MRQPVPLVAETGCLIEKFRDVVSLRQATRMLVVIFGAQRRELFWPFSCGPEELGLSQSRRERDHVGELGHPALELDVREHHVHEGPREGSELRTVGLGEEVIVGEFAKQLDVAATNDAQTEAGPSERTHAVPPGAPSLPQAFGRR